MTDTQPLRAVPGTTEPVDHERIERAVREILFAIGEDPDRDGLVRTPARVAEMYAEIFAGLSQDPARHLVVTFEAEHDEMVRVPRTVLTTTNMRFIPDLDSDMDRSGSPDRPASISVSRGRSSVSSLRSRADAAVGTAKRPTEATSALCRRWSARDVVPRCRTSIRASGWAVV